MAQTKQDDVPSGKERIGEFRLYGRKKTLEENVGYSEDKKHANSKSPLDTFSNNIIDVALLLVKEPVDLEGLKNKEGLYTDVTTPNAQIDDTPTLNEQIDDTPRPNRPTTGGGNMPYTINISPTISPKIQANPQFHNNAGGQGGGISKKKYNALVEKIDEAERNIQKYVKKTHERNQGYDYLISQIEQLKVEIQKGGVEKGDYDKIKKIIEGVIGKDGKKIIPKARIPIITQEEYDKHKGKYKKAIIIKDYKSANPSEDDVSNDIDPHEIMSRLRPDIIEKAIGKKSSEEGYKGVANGSAKYKFLNMTKKQQDEFNRAVNQATDSYDQTIAEPGLGKYVSKFKKGLNNSTSFLRGKRKYDANSINNALLKSVKGYCSDNSRDVIGKYSDFAGGNRVTTSEYVKGVKGYVKGQREQLGSDYKKINKLLDRLEKKYSKK